MRLASKSAKFVFSTPMAPPLKAISRVWNVEKIKILTWCATWWAINTKKRLIFLLFIEAGLTRIIGSGACLSRNPVLRTEFQEIYHMPVEFTNEGSACIGAALSTIDVHHSS